MNKKMNAQNLVHVKFYRILCVVLVLFSINAKAMVIRINFWGDNYSHVEVTKDCKSWIVNKTTDEKTPLSMTSDGFELDDKVNLREIKLLVEYPQGKIHTIHLSTRKNVTEPITVGIGNSDYLYYPLTQQRPFYPINDRIYLEIDNEKVKARYPDLSTDLAMSNIREELYQAGVSKSKPYGRNVYQIHPGQNRTDVVNKILNLGVEGIIAPLAKYKKGATWSVSFHLAEVDVLIKPEVADQTALTLLHLKEVDEVVKHSSNSITWRDYEKGKAFRIKFNKRSMLNHNFLYQLQYLMNDNRVLAIKTKIGRPVVLD